MKKFFFILSLFISQLIQAQLCNGSLGDPVVNITFGNKQNNIAPLKAGITNLQYIASGCPNDGYYTIASTSYNCFGSTWHNITQDHTGDNGGRFMLINASYNPNDFYIDTVTGLCGNTTYEFGAWVTNVVNSSNSGGSKPNLTFKLETITGVVLGKYNTGSINEENSLNWKQYGFFFKPEISTSQIVLRITNNAPGGMGNDLAIDDITFRPCGPTITGSIQGGTDEMVTCIDQQVPYDFSTSVDSGFIDPVFQWQLSIDSGKIWTDISGANTTTFTRMPSIKSGLYLYRMLVGERTNSSNKNCQIASNKISIRIVEIPSRNEVLFLQGCTGSKIELTSTNNLDVNYFWSGPNNFSANTYNPVLTNIQFSDSGNYQVLLSNNIGCTANETIHLNVVEGVKAIIYPTFSVVCENETVSLKAIGGNTYKWRPQLGINAITLPDALVTPVIDTSIYWVAIKNNAGCADSTFATIIRIKNPTVDAGSNQTILQGNAASLSGSINGIYANCFWNPVVGIANPYNLNTTVFPNQSTTYYLTANGMNNCPSVVDSVFITVLLKVNIPNAFSPNGDGINDTWTISGLETYPHSSVLVFNIYGQQVFYQKPYSKGWDGSFKSTQLPVGAYYYIIERGAGYASLNGNVLLIR